MAAASVLLDPGPIPYLEIELFGDPDLEHGLRHLGLDPAATTYRLVEIPVGAVDATRAMANWTWTPRSIIEAMKRGQELPPIVVFRTASEWDLIDGVNRTYAAWQLGIATIRAYELVQAPPGQIPSAPAVSRCRR